MTRRVLLQFPMVVVLLFGLICSAAWAAPTVSQALRLTPIQKDITYDSPDEAEVEQCTLKAEPIGDHTGWVVRNKDGQLLRRFIDTNGDKKVDLWCYYHNGVEVYRDIDADFDTKADQYRWLGTAGTRWGLDPNEDGNIDSWKLISAEEVSAEIVAALGQRDRRRFERLLISASELNSLGLGKEQEQIIRRRLQQAPEEFAALARTQKVVRPDSAWIHFGAARPGLVPEGTDGLKKDLIVYENVVAVIETGGEHGQVPLGTLVQVGGAWRAIDLPVGLGETTAAVGNGFFFASARSAVAAAESGAPAGDWQPWVRKLEDIDKQLAAASTAQQLTALNKRRAEVIENLIDTLPADQRETWIRQFADTVSHAVQSGDYPEGIERLEQFFNRIRGGSHSKELEGYVKFRWMSAEYGANTRRAVNDSKVDLAKVQEQWLESLAGYVRDYPKTTDAAEAMLQLAIAEEFAGKDSDAQRWYGRIVSDFPDDSRAEKAQGAIRRLGSQGKTIPLKGTSVRGQQIDLGDLRGKVVLVHYWATWCEPCKDQLATLKKLHQTYGPKGFTLIGISLDNDRGPLQQYLARHPLAWPQLFEEGGLDGRLANELGVLSLPTMLLIDRQGRVANRGVHVAQLEEELKELLK